MAEKKVGAFELNTRRSWIEPAHPLLSISSQCALAGMNRSTWYYPVKGESEENLAFMRLLDEQYTRMDLTTEKCTGVIE